MSRRSGFNPFPPRACPRWGCGRPRVRGLVLWCARKRISDNALRRHWGPQREILGLVQNRPLRGGAGRGLHAQDGSGSQSRFIAIGDPPPAAQWPAHRANRPGGPQELGVPARNHPRVLGSEIQNAKVCVCGLKFRRPGNLCSSRKNAIFGALAASDRQDLGGLMEIWISRSKTRFRHPPPRRAKGEIGPGSEPAHRPSGWQRQNRQGRWGPDTRGPVRARHPALNQAKFWVGDPTTNVEGRTT
jgi:hypothetical protein